MPPSTHTSPLYAAEPEFVPPLRLNPAAPSLCGVEDASPALIQTVKTHAQARLQIMLKAVPEAVVSNNRALSGSDLSTINDEEMTQGLFGFGVAFTWDDAEAIWEIEKTKPYALKARKSMSDADSAVDAQLRKSDQLYRDGKIPEAQEGYLFVEGHNKVPEFTLLITEGNLRLFQLGQVASAQQYYQRAVKMLYRKHLYFTSYALLHHALCCFYLGSPAKAAKLAKQAVDYLPEFTEAHYQYAQYEMLCDRPKVALKALQKVLCQDRRYIAKIMVDPCFAAIHDEMLGKLEVRKEEVISDLEPMLALGREVVELLSSDCVESSPLAQLRQEMLDNLKFASDAQVRPGFLDAMAAVERIQRVFVCFEKSNAEMMGHIGEHARKLRSDLEKKKYKIKSNSLGKQRFVATFFMLMGLSGCSALMYRSTDADTAIAAVSVALGVTIIGGLLSIAVPNLLSKDAEFRALRSELESVECQSKILKRIHKLLDGRVSEEMASGTTTECGIG